MSIREKLSEEQKKLIRHMLYTPYMLRDILFCWIKGLQWYPDWRLRGLPYISVKGPGSVLKIGRTFTAGSDNKRHVMGIFQRVTIKVRGHDTKMVIGDSVGISGCTISAATSIIIGNHVLIGSGCLITDTDWHPIDPEERRLDGGGESAPIVIEDDVFIGARAIVLKGVTIGKGSVIGAGAVVAKSIPPYSIAVGNPAKVIGDSRRNKRH